MNELLLRHLFTHIDGSTSGPYTFSREIGQQLENCEKRSVVQFQPIAAELLELSTQEMSSDQKYLYRIVSAVITGIFPEDLGHKLPEKCLMLDGSHVKTEFSVFIFRQNHFPKISLL
jgi:hypothetical protein